MMNPTRTFILRVMAVAATVATAPWHSARSQDVSRAGLWTIELISADSADTTGFALSLAPVRPGTITRGLTMATPTHAGMIGALRLRTAFALHTDIDMLVVAEIRGDSILIHTHPAHDHGGLVLRGVFSNDAVTGSWYVRGNHLREARGEFSMRPWRRLEPAP